jgi:lysine 2,3-aminomutase
MRVKPYYLHHLDQARGTSHFRVPVEHGLDMIHVMRGKLSGMGIPHYVVDPPGGEGKVPLLRNNLHKLGETVEIRTACGLVALPNGSDADVV